MQENKTTAKVVRDSNIELLRIVAMFLVLIDHSGYMSIDPPTQGEVLSAPGLSFARFGSQAFSSICVNVFVLISGWFGIKFKGRRVADFLFQSYFICMAVYLLFLATDRAAPMSMSQWVSFLVFDDLWFVKAFLILYLFSPLLNLYIESITSRHFAYFLLAFFALIMAHGFITQSPWLEKGMSPLTLMWLYMLGRYMRLNPNRLTSMSKWMDMMAYVVLSLVSALCAFISVKHGMEGYRFFSYNAPFLILASVFFFLFFTKFTLRSRFVNWVAASSFAVYVLNCAPYFWDFYLSNNHQWWVNGDWQTYVVRVIVFDIAVFTFAILLDKIRMLVWKPIAGSIGRDKKVK